MGTISTHVDLGCLDGAVVAELGFGGRLDGGGRRDLLIELLSQGRCVEEDIHGVGGRVSMRSRLGRDGHGAVQRVAQMLVVNNRRGIAGSFLVYHC